MNAGAIREKVRALLPEIAQRAAESEAAYRMPADLAEKLRRTGVFAMAVPKRAGGPEMDIGDILSVIEEIAAADAAAAWNVSIAVQSTSFTGFLPAKTFEAMYREAPDLAFAGGAAPTGKATPVAGGYIVSGRWSWGSGIQHADWIGSGCLVTPEGKAPLAEPSGRPIVRVAIVRAREAALCPDTWRTAGLRGTGSCDYAIEGVFVPEDHTYDLFGGSPNGPEPALFPAFMMAGLHFACIATGAAQGALEDVIDLATGGKRRLFSAAKSADQPVFQFRLGEAEAKIRAARAAYRALARQLWREAANMPRGPALYDDPIAIGCAPLSRSAALLCVDAIETLHHIAGGSAVHDAFPLSRRLRDIHTLTQHIALSDPSVQRHGAALLGRA